MGILQTTVTTAGARTVHNLEPWEGVYHRGSAEGTLLPSRATRWYGSMLTQSPTSMQGDLLLPHCGIRTGMRGRLRRQVNYVVHCAASIIFNEHVHTLLANNYQVGLTSCFSALQPLTPARDAGLQ